MQQYEIRIDPLNDEGEPSVFRGHDGFTPDLANLGFGFKVALVKDVEDDGVVSRMILATTDLLRPAPLPLDSSSPPERVEAGEYDHEKRFAGWVLLSTKPQEVGEWLVSCSSVIQVVQAPWIESQDLRTSKAWRDLHNTLEEVVRNHPLIHLLAVEAPIVRNVYSKLKDFISSRAKIRCCGECRSWDRQEGIAEFNRITHHFEGGETAQLNKDIARLVSSERNVANIREDLLGLCTRNDRLIESDFPACHEFDEGVR